MSLMDILIMAFEGFICAVTAVVATLLVISILSNNEND
jgi:uncharacterized membrane protein